MHSNFEFSSSEEEWNTGTLNAEERVNTIQKKEMLEHLMQKKEKLSSFIAQNNFGENCLHSQHRRRWERCKYEFWPTKEKLRTTNLIDSKDCHFSTFVWWGKPCILFWFRCYRCINFNQIYSSILDEQILPCATIVKKNIMKEWRKIDVIARGRVGTAIWNCPKPKLLLLKNTLKENKDWLKRSCSNRLNDKFCENYSCRICFDP